MTIADGSGAYTAILHERYPSAPAAPLLCPSEGSNARPYGADARRSFESTTCSFSCASFRECTPRSAPLLAFILGSAVLAPSLARRERLWLSAGDASALKDGEPLAVTLRVARQDGASEVVDRRVVFLVRSGDAGASPRLDLHAPWLPHALQCGDLATSNVRATAASTTSPGRSSRVRRRTRSTSCRRASTAIESWSQV